MSADKKAEDMSPEELEKLQIQNCIFCKMGKGEIPAKKVFDNGAFIGILDINPGAEGHILLFPKDHIQMMPQLNSEKLEKLSDATQKISSMMLKSLSAKGTSVFIANGFVAGQKSPHMIVHIIPRTDGDGISLNPKLMDVNDKDYARFMNGLQSSLGINTQKNDIQKEKKDKMPAEKEEKKENKTEPEIEKSHSKKRNVKEQKEIEMNDSDDDVDELDLVTRMFTGGGK